MREMVFQMEKCDDDNKDIITSEFLLKKIDETIEFDKKMKDPEFLKEMEIERERMKNLDLSQFFKDET